MIKEELGINVHFHRKSAEYLKELLEKYIAGYEIQEPHAYGENVSVEIQASGFDPHWIIDLGYALDAISNALNK